MAVCGPDCCQGTDSGEDADETRKEEVRGAKARTTVVESTDPQKSPDSTYRFEAFSVMENSTA